MAKNVKKLNTSAAEAVETSIGAMLIVFGIDFVNSAATDTQLAVGAAAILGGVLANYLKYKTRE